jgi:hypothetical protein
MIGIAVAGVGADLARSWKNTSITTIRKVFQITSNSRIFRKYDLD